MRLGTLARKISITPTKLSAFLESASVELTSGTNTKLSEEQIEMVLTHFNASLIEETATEEPTTNDSEAPLSEAVAESTETEAEIELDEAAEEAINSITEIKEVESPVEEEETMEEPVESAPDKEESNKISDSFAEIALPHELEEAGIEMAQHSDDEPIDQSDPVSTQEPTIPSQPTIEIDPEIESQAERAAYDESIEVIKPQKVVLPGLKVKGKIDLPEPKAATAPEEEETKEEKSKPYDPNEIITTTGPKRDRRRKPKNYKGKKYDKNYNPVEAARKKKEWEEKKRKEQEERRKKKAKSKHYNKTVKAQTPAKPVRKKSKKAATKATAAQEQKPGNVFQKFWRWMNT